jgi:DNA-binding CsgD family transcriptional regulator
MPETMSPQYAAAEREAYRGVRRACDAGLDSMTLRTVVRRRIARLIPSEATYFNSLDPHTGLLADLVGEGAPAEVERRFLEFVYPLADAERTIDLARSGHVVTTESSEEMAGLMRDAGFGRELRAAFALDDEPRGMWVALREGGSRAFGEHDIAFVHRIAPHVARALKRAALVDAAQLASLEADDGESRELAPGVIVIDDHWRITQWTAAAESQLADLADASTATLAPTSAIVDLVTRQRAPGGAGGVDLLSVPGRSGRWYTLRAATTEPDEFGRSSTVVIITPAGRKEASPRLTRRYGLSAQERETVSLAVRGFAVEEIADRLRILPLAVQGHLDRAAVKIGVRGRRALLAKLFLDSDVPRRVD